MRVCSHAHLDIPRHSSEVNLGENAETWGRCCETGRMGIFEWCGATFSGHWKTETTHTTVMTTTETTSTTATLKTLPCNKDYCSGFGVRLSCHNHYRSDFCTCCKHYLSDFYSSNTYPIGYMQFFQLHIFSCYGKIFNRNSHNNYNNNALCGLM